jgi:uncharacterized protein
MSELPAFIQALLAPEAYPEPPANIELVQTQMSFVFIAGEFVYKIKKPVDLGYLDYTTAAKRLYFCQREVELNRRLCPDAYLGVVPITREGQRFSIAGPGEVIEHAVKMRRLPSTRMLDTLLREDRVTAEMMDEVAARLAEFHQGADTSEQISAFGDLDAIRCNTRENFSQTEKYIGQTISARTYRSLQEYTESFLQENTARLRRRVSEGRIRDCHGDIHAAHVCLNNGVCIYDCIEFNDRFRYCDVASEVAFLAMDLDHYGRADLSHRFATAYRESSRDDGVPPLLHFYKGYRAYVRGKVESFKREDLYLSPEEKDRATATAASYFDLAQAYTRIKPLLLITVGLVGTGKSTVAHALAKHLGIMVISSDVTRKTLAGIPLTERRLHEPDSGIYSADFTRRTYDEIFRRARDFLTNGVGVTLDASFTRSAGRLRAARLAAETGADFFIVECTLDEASVRDRLEKRLKGVSISDGRWEIYLPQKKAFEPVSEVPVQNHIVIDTSKKPESNARLIIDKIM